MVIGRDLIRSLGIDIHGADMTIHWDDAVIPWRDIYSTTNNMFALSQHNAPFNFETKIMKRILDAKYSKANIKTIAERSTNLDSQERNELYTLLKKYECLFDGNLGHGMVSPMVLNLNQMQNHIMENLFLFHAYMNSRSNKNSIDSSILRS